MYSFEFLENLKYFNSIMLFHNEKHNVDKSILLPLKERLIPPLKRRYPDRTIDEILVMLQYPGPDSSKTTFMQFFDSPFCASAYRKDFKGIFIIDCSSYDKKNAIELCWLFDYVKENASDTFNFIILFSSDVIKDILRLIENDSVSKCFSTELELDKSLIESYKTRFDDATYSKLKANFSNPQIKTKSIDFVKGVLDFALSTKEDIETVIAKLAVDNADEKRRIGF